MIMGILTTLLIIILGYYLLVFLGRLSLPWIRAYAHKKTEQYFQEFFSANTAKQEPEAPEGSVSIDKMPSRKKRSNKAVGEYIEYEEVE